MIGYLGIFRWHEVRKLVAAFKLCGIEINDR